MCKSICILLLLAVMTVGAAAFAEETAKGNIHPNFKLSASERFRLVSWDNTVSLSDEADAATSFTRHRTSIMGQWYPTAELEFGLKLTNEFRYYLTPRSVDFNWNEVFVDQLYAKGTFDRFTLTVGRQNIMLGEGFVLWDGGPLDGSRSAYFNAVRMDVKPCPKGTISLFYFYQPVYDDYLPLIDDQNKALVERDEQGFGGYVSRDVGKSNVQAYYIRKNIIDTTDSEVLSGINTIGARIHVPFYDRWSFTGEGAYQFGTYEELDRAAMGGYAYLNYKTDWPAYLPNQLTIGGVHLTGDDPQTEDREAWEPQFGRWPKWSESYIYTLLNEDGVAYWSNYINLFGSLQFDLTSDIGLKVEYQHLLAPQAFGNSPLQSTGNTRGDLFIGKLTYGINRYLSGHLLWEHFEPGNYYRGDGADPATWIRFELMLNVS